MLANTGTMLDFPSYNNRLSELTYINVILCIIYIHNFNACSTVTVSSAGIAIISIIGIFTVMIIVI